ncbi:MAG: acyl-CoA dehydrogenase family protein [Pseudomonadota bacterium]
MSEQSTATIATDAAERQLLEQAQTLSDAFLAQSAAIEDARRIPPAVSAQMARAGFYRLGIPRSIGGLEAAPAVSSAIFETLARGDAACAWVAFIGTTSGTALSGLSAVAAKEIFPHPDTLITGVFAPTARADRVPGGFRVSGRWQWGSGSQNADWILGGCLLYEHDEPMLDRHGRPRSHMLAMPADAVETLDNWHVSGLCGTGSVDYEVRDLFVPEHRAVGFAPGEHPPLGPLFKFPNFTFLALGIGAVCLGIARAAIDDLMALASSKKRVGSKTTIAHKASAQATLANAEASLRGARLLYYETLGQAWSAAVQGERVTIAQRRDVRLATTHAVQACLAVVDDMYHLGGGSSVYRDSPLQRHFRNIHVASQHIMVAPSTLETIGADLFGVDVNTSML